MFNYYICKYIMKTKRLEIRKNGKILNKKLKKNDWYVIFGKDCKFLYIGLKYWNNIDNKYKDNDKYKIVILNNREILRGMNDNFQKYFNLFKNITAYINEDEIECVIDFADDEYDILRRLLEDLINI